MPLPDNSSTYQHIDHSLMVAAAAIQQHNALTRYHKPPHSWSGPENIDEIRQYTRQSVSRNSSGNSRHASSVCSMSAIYEGMVIDPEAFEPLTSQRSGSICSTTAGSQVLCREDSIEAVAAAVEAAAASQPYWAAEAAAYSSMNWPIRGRLAQLRDDVVPYSAEVPASFSNWYAADGQVSGSSAAAAAVLAAMNSTAAPSCDNRGWAHSSLYDSYDPAVAAGMHGRSVPPQHYHHHQQQQPAIMRSRCDSGNRSNAAAAAAAAAAGASYSMPVPQMQTPGYSEPSFPYGPRRRSLDLPPYPPMPALGVTQIHTPQSYYISTAKGHTFDPVAAGPSSSGSNSSSSRRSPRSSPRYISSTTSCPLPRHAQASPNTARQQQQQQQQRWYQQQTLQVLDHEVQQLMLLGQKLEAATAAAAPGSAAAAACETALLMHEDAMQQALAAKAALLADLVPSPSSVTSCPVMPSTPSWQQQQQHYTHPKHQQQQQQQQQQQRSQQQQRQNLQQQQSMSSPFAQQGQQQRTHQAGMGQEQQYQQQRQHHQQQQLMQQQQTHKHHHQQQQQQHLQQQQQQHSMTSTLGQQRQQQRQVVTWQDQQQLLQPQQQQQRQQPMQQQQQQQQQLSQQQPKQRRPVTRSATFGSLTPLVQSSPEQQQQQVAEVQRSSSGPLSLTPEAHDKLHMLMRVQKMQAVLQDELRQLLPMA